jgi:hypothetical protein
LHSGYVTIKAFRAKSGKENELENVMKTQWDSLNAAGLVSWSGGMTEGCGPL